MKKLRGVFELTVPEQRVIIVLLSIFVAVIAFRSYRAQHQPAPAIEAQPSPSPGIRP